MGLRNYISQIAHLPKNGETTENSSFGQERDRPCTVASILFLKKVSQTIGGIRNIFGSNINLTSGKWEE